MKVTNESSLPNKVLFKQMIPCPECGAEYCIDAMRRGPAIIGITSNSFLPICLNCWHKAKKGRSDRGALENWNKETGKLGLRNLRQRAGLTVSELSQLANVGMGSISGYERGYREPSIRTKQKLANALGISTNEL